MAGDGNVIARRIAAPGFQMAVPDGGNKLAGAADAIGGFAEHIFKAREENTLVESRLAFNRQLDDLYTQTLHDGDPATAPERFAKQAQDMAAPFYSQFRSDEARNSFSLDAGNALESRRIALTDAAYAKERDQANASLDEAADYYAKQAAYHTNPAERQTAIDGFSKTTLGLAERGLISHEAASARVAKFTNNLSLYDGRVAIERDPAAAQKLLADPKNFAGLDPLQRIQLQGAADARVKEQERAAREAQQQARVNASFSLSDLQEAASAGLPVADDVKDQAIADVRASGDPRLMRRLEGTLRGVAVSEGLRGARPQEVEASLGALAAKANQDGADPGLAAAYNGALHFQATQNAKLGQDPLSYANAQGVIHLVPLTLTGTDQPSAWQARLRAAGAVAQHYGTSPRYLTAAEGETAKEALAPNADPKAKAAMLSMLVKGLGSRAIPELSRLGISPALVTAGGLMTAGPAHQQAARDIIAGETLLTETAKGGDGQSRLRPTAAAKTRARAGSSGFFGGVALPQGLPQASQALVLVPGEAARASAAADAIYAARAQGQGFSGKDADGDGQALYDRSLQEALGARYEGETQMGGMSHYRGFPVVVPAIIAADSFEGLVRHLTATDLAHASQTGAPPVDAAGQPLAPDFIKHAWLVTAGDGLYAVSATNPANGAVTPVRDARGGVYRLNFARALALLQARGGQ